MKKTILSLSFVLASLCGKSYAQTNVFDNIIATSPNHTLLEAALLQEGLASVLQNPSANLTVFAPDDQAITSLLEFVLPKLSRTELKADIQETESCIQIIRLHDNGKDVKN